MCYIDLLINHNIKQSQATADEKVEIRMAKKRKTSLNLMQKSWQALVDLQNVVRYFLKKQSSPKAVTKYEGQNICCDACFLLFFAAGS